MLGCSGLIQRLLSEGKRVDVVILSGGGKSHAGCCRIEESTLVESRRNLSRRAAKVLGLPLEHLYFLDYPDGSIAFDCAETEKLKTLIERSLEQNYVPIVDDRGIFIGIVTRKSIIKYLMNHTMKPNSCN